MFNAPTGYSLSTTEVDKVVYSYEQSEVTDQLYVFGSVLLAEIQDRAKQIDEKAVTVLGWSLAVLAFLFTQANNFGSGAALFLAIICAISASLATICAYRAREARRAWGWPSDMDWFEAAKDGADELKRYHIRAMHAARQAQLDLTGIKGTWLIRSEKLLVFAGATLGVAVLFRLLTSSGLQIPLIW